MGVRGAPRRRGYDREVGLVAIAILLAALAAGCGTRGAEPAVSGSAPRVVITTADGAEVGIAVEVADSSEERQRGLMGRTELPDGTGMGFLFGGPTTAAFWMKDTLIPLSIAFWNAQGRIVAILDMPTCVADPCPTYAPGIPYVGALEVRRGYFAERGVATGDPVTLERVDG